MDQVHVIRHKVLIEGRSRREVAAEMGVSRNTVRKYVEKAEPTFTNVCRGRPALERVRERLDELIAEWGERTTRKQRLTGTRLHRQLRDEGYDVGITTVRNYFREKKRECAEVFVPLVHRTGDEAQIDFFEVTVEVDGVRCKRWMFVLRLMYSGRDFAWLYEHCDQVSFFDGHVRAFAHFAGVPARCVYDNLSPAVRKVMFPGRELTRRFTALVSHYLFEPCFARPRTGHDKGGIEGRGKVIRYQHLVPIPRGAALDEIAAELLSNLDAQAATLKNREGRTVAERFAEEQPLLRPVPVPPFEPRQVLLLQANRKALVSFGGATYSVPSHWQQLEITAYVGPTDIRFVCREEIQLRARVGRKQRNIRYRDYLDELRRKPQAVRQVAPELLEELSEPFRELWKLLELSHGGREAGRIFAKVLAAVVEHGEVAVSDALKKALTGGERNLLKLGDIIRAPLPAAIEVPEALRHYIVEAAKATDFDWMLDEANR